MSRAYRRVRWVAAIAGVLAALAILLNGESHGLHRMAALEVYLPDAPPWRAESRGVAQSRCRRLLLGNHAVSPGESVVLSSRFYEQHWESVDAATYEQISIEIDNPREGETISLPSNRVRVFYSRGGQVWASNCRGLFGTEAKGSVSFPWVTRYMMKVDVKIDVPTRYAVDFVFVDTARVRYTSVFW